MRKCNRCGIEKQLEEFAKNASRADGRDYTCKRCRRLENRLRGRKTAPFSAAKREKTTPPRPMMADEVFREYYHNKTLRGYINWYSLSRSKRRKDDMRQIAWSEIAMCKPGMHIEYYKTAAKRAIDREYKRAYVMRKYELEFVESMSAQEYLKWQLGIVD